MSNNQTKFVPPNPQNMATTIKYILLFEILSTHVFQDDTNWSSRQLANNKSLLKNVKLYSPAR